MKNLIGFVTIILFSVTCKGQVDNNKLLETFLNDSDFCTHIIPSCKKCQTINIVDTLNYFKKDVKIGSNSKIIITKEFNKKHPFPQNNGELLKWNCSNLFITQIQRGKNYIQINYFHSPTNGTGYIKYRIHGMKLIKVKWQFGQI